MKCYAQFSCPNYSTAYPDDFEKYDSLKEIKDELWRRYDGYSRPKYPLISEQASFLVWLGKPKGEFPCDCPPDREIYFGPRLGIKCKRL